MEWLQNVEKYFRERNVLDHLQEKINMEWRYAALYGKCVYEQKDKLHVAQMTHHDYEILSSNTILVYYLAFECCNYSCPFPSGKICNKKKKLSDYVINLHHNTLRLIRVWIPACDPFLLFSLNPLVLLIWESHLWSSRSEVTRHLKFHFNQCNIFLFDNIFSFVFWDNFMVTFMQ